MSKRPRILLDTTVLCGALVQPNSINFKLLMLARAASFYEPIISEVVVVEFIKHCRLGIGGITYSEEEIDRFWNVVTPLLEPESIERISIGRRYAEYVKFYVKPIEEVVYELTGRNHSELLDAARASGLKYCDIDSHDLHLLVAAVEHLCDYLCTANVNDRPEGIGAVKVIKPGALYGLLTD
ncbi:MAG: PIN domain-containing protein [Actinomycetota bacterium]|nr:PIN domain-containing protein [Actinomycetota bacterium]